MEEAGPGALVPPRVDAPGRAPRPTGTAPAPTVSEPPPPVTASPNALSGVADRPPLPARGGNLVLAAPFPDTTDMPDTLRGVAIARQTTAQATATAFLMLQLGTWCPRLEKCRWHFLLYAANHSMLAVWRVPNRAWMEGPVWWSGRPSTPRGGWFRQWPSRKTRTLRPACTLLEATVGGSLADCAAL